MNAAWLAFEHAIVWEYGLHNKICIYELWSLEFIDKHLLSFSSCGMGLVCGTLA